MNFILATDLCLLNTQDSLPTFLRYSSIGWPELTLCSHSLFRYSPHWEVLDNLKNSDHRYILISIDTPKENYHYIRYKILDGNHHKFLETLQINALSIENEISRALSTAGLDTVTIILQKVIIVAYNKSFKTKKQSLINIPNWWTDNLETDKNKILALKSGIGINGHNMKTPLQRNQKFKLHVKSAKGSGWRKICTTASNPYGKHYKAAFRKTIFSTQIPLRFYKDPEGSLHDMAKHVLERLYDPPEDPTIYTAFPISLCTNPFFNNQEISLVIRHLPEGNAPGYDRINNLILKILHQ
ncbi:hypothetical protein AVEN_264862-1 [Araneus ventricosus]|uniref:Endonuclease/exonuclease/phosphatase domain-containing protein n=1 Tax=Araneus ventricosus TaxID=182803 RepID=A0A4Y2L4N6_ARAVE|nr:hypothetical protein AVEN_264862-1 [Araneus ventricosus]